MLPKIAQKGSRLLCPILANDLPSFEDITFLDEDGNEVKEDDETTNYYTNYDIYDNSRFGHAVWRDLCSNSTVYDHVCECPHDREPPGDLLQVCRTLNHEISQQFYSRNAFVVHRCAHDGILHTMQNFRANLRFLTSLRIEVNDSLISHHASKYSDFHTARVSTWQRGWQSYPWPQRDATSGTRYCQCYPNDPAPEGIFHPYRYSLCEGVDKPFSTISCGAGRLALREL
jgi:hypothetical protein